jgi:hypothetical protein
MSEKTCRPPDRQNDVERAEPDAFSRWFTQSQVVDAAGEPLQLYHATAERFTRFGVPHDIGFHFGTLEQSQRRAAVRGYTDLIAVYLSLQSVVEMPDLGDWEPWRFTEEGMRDAYVLDAVGGGLRAAFTKFDIESLQGAFDRAYAAHDTVAARGACYQALRELFLSKKYDGIMYRNVAETPNEAAGDYSYIALHPNQIKAVHNSGAFDPDSNDIFDGAQHPSPVAGE